MTDEEVRAHTDELVAALTIEHARIKRKRDVAKQMLEALRKLSNEVRRSLTELRTIGYTNYGVLEQREEEARAAIEAAEATEATEATDGGEQ